jgi:pimeloyl-ACP methyl ester carboxylesterase
VRVDDAQYNAYVQDDLVQCSVEALQWVTERYGGSAGAQPYVLLSGHSEGAQVSLRLLNRLAQSHDALAARVRGLFLSGLPMTDWKRMLGAQLSEHDRQTFFTAFQRKDDHVLRTFGNLSAHYLQSVFAQETLDATLEQLAERGTDARFFIYQGLYDHHTPPGPIMDFVARNRSRMAQHQRALSLRSRFYPAGHSLNAQALRDIRRDVEAFVETAGKTTTAGM